MQIFKSLDEIRIENNTAIALGNFDGVHLGHQEILYDAINAARCNRLKSVCFTFSNHPANVITGRNENDSDALKLICSEERKVKIIESMGFDYLVSIPFNYELMSMSALDFFNILKKAKAKVVSVGFNYTFGAKASGNAELLYRLGNQNGIEVHVHDAVKVDHQIVSSSIIREKIIDGDMGAVTAFLGRPYSFSGVIEHGKSVGAANGVPTINIKVANNRVIPPVGVYCGYVVLDDSRYYCVINLGHQPTFNGKQLKIEAHLFDYKGDAYGKQITIYFVDFIRPEIKFEDSVSLYNQISEDCEIAKKLLDIEPLV